MLPTVTPFSGKLGDSDLIRYMMTSATRGARRTPSDFQFGGRLACQYSDLDSVAAASNSRKRYVVLSVS
jgi:hypothetical protein